MVVYNRYRHRVHGEEVVVETTEQLLREAGVAVTSFVESSEGLPGSRWKKAWAGLTGIYNPGAARRLSQELDASRPDVAHFHNIYPLISPSALVAARRSRVPVVMTVHHYGLSCPVLTHYRAGRLCVDCTHGARELNCLSNNCRKSRAESAAYALRSFVSRRMRWFLDGVALFIALSGFAKRQLVEAGFPAARIVVRPNMVRLTPFTQWTGPQDYVAYVGRITEEKGVDLLCDAARMTHLPVRIAGDVGAWPELAARHAASPPHVVPVAAGAGRPGEVGGLNDGDAPSVDFVGVLRGEELRSFYRGARFLVVPSRWWEVCPLVVLEAMNHGCPVLAARVGGLPELVEHERTGLLFAPNDARALAGAMLRLWGDEPLRRRLSQAARARLEARFSATPYLEDLLSIYRRAAGGPDRAIA